MKTLTPPSATAARSMNSQPFFAKGGEATSFWGEKSQESSFFSQPTIQPKLKIGPANDHFEQQADSVAHDVVSKLNSPQTVNRQAPAVQSTTPSTPSVQTKCDTCGQEEKLQKKEEEVEHSQEKLQRKPIFDSAADPPEDTVQRKCDACEQEEKVQKKGEDSGETASSDVSSRLSSSKGGGSPLSDGVRTSMESAMGADFSGVRIHTGSEASQLSQDLSAHAFTHGNDIYFNEGQYSPSSSDGQRLLAHELTHTVQQGASVKRKLKPKSTAPFIQKAPAPAVVAPVSSEVVDLSSGTFNPSEKVKAEIEATDRKGLDVRVKVGPFAESGIIKIKKDRKKDEYDSDGLGHLALTNTWLKSVPNVTLGILIKDNKITGGVAIGKSLEIAAFIKQLQQNPLLVGAGLSVGKAPAQFDNKLENGTLTLGFSALKITIGGFLEADLNLHLENMNTPVFDGSAKVNVKGIAEGSLQVDNKKEGKLSGVVTLGISQFKNFSGQAEVKYNADGTVDIHGKAAYSGDKLSGEIDLVVTDEKTADDFAKDAIKAAGGKENIQNATPPAAVPVPKEGKKDRALAGVGQLTFNLTTWFAGTVNVIVDGKGDVTVIGKIAPPAEIILFEQKDWDKEIFKLEAKAIYGIPVVGNLNVFANVSLSAIAKLGPAKIYNIEILGTYSTDPTVQKSIQIAGSLNISAYAGLRLRAEGGAGLTILDHDFKIGVGVNADVGVKAYADARPTIGWREPGEFYVSGTLEMVAQPTLGLSGDFFIAIDTPWWSPLSDDKWIWPIASKEWPLTDPIGLSAEVKDYVLGSGKVPEVEMKKPEFDGSKFMSNMVDKQLPEKSGSGKEGQSTFKEDGTVKKPADVPPPKKGKGAEPAAEPKGGKKPDSGKGVPPKKPEPPNAETQKKATEILKAAAAPLDKLKGQGPLTKTDLNVKLTAIKQQVNGVDFDVQLQGKQWVVKPKALGVVGGAKSALKIEATVTPDDEKASKGNDTITSALGEIDQEGKQKIADGEVTKSDADQIAADVKRDHPSVIQSITVIDGGDAWDFEYVQRVLKGTRNLKKSNTTKKASGQHQKIFGLITSPEIIDRNGNLNCNSSTLDRRIGGSVADSMQAHHAISCSVASPMDIMKAAQESGYDINNANNGILLPSSEKKWKQLQRQGNPLPLHRGNHTSEYYSTVSDLLISLSAKVASQKNTSEAYSEQKLISEIRSIENKIKGSLRSYKLVLSLQDPLSK